ncbi:Rne/Rng family ribonuclease [Demetria terragena]|uniref:Rne/Rng family ribonuclease n=1 Tax=Demetria terragena TaxID=63959 RepID=UPI000365FA55|nr:ribonuclease E/G [Demetria terragena]
MSLDFSDQSDPASAGSDKKTAEPAAAPAFGLIFQAPDPQTRVPAREPVRDEPLPEQENRSSGSPKEDSSDGRSAGRQEAKDTKAAKGKKGDKSKRASKAKDTDGGGDAAPGAPSESSDEDDQNAEGGNRRRRGGRGRTRKDADAGDHEAQDSADDGSGDNDSSESADGDSDGEGNGSRRRRRRRRGGSGAGESDDPPGTVTKVREARKPRDEVTSIKGSTRLEAKRQRRREGREAGRRRTVITEAEFLARRESVERTMVVREREGRTQIGVMEDDVLVEHYVSRESQQASMAGNVYLGRVQNVLPSMEAAFVDIGRGRNAVLYAGEVNWDAAGMESNQPKRIENALKSGETVLVQVTKDPIGHKGARLTSQISLPGRYLVYVPNSSMTGISRKLPDTERSRLKKILKEVVPEDGGVIVRTAAEGASEEELRADVERLVKTWEQIQKKAGSSKASAPSLLQGESEMTVRVIRDVFNEDFSKLIVSGDSAWTQISDYVDSVAPDLKDRLQKWTGEKDVFAVNRVDEQLAKAMDRKVWLPSGGSLIIDRTEAMTVVDVNTGKFVGSGGNLEETVTKNNIEAAEEIVRQLRLRDIGGIIVVDFIDMVLEANRDLVVRRLLECLGRDRTKHQVAEVTSLGLVQMTRKRVGSGLIEIFSEPCEHCAGRGLVIHDKPVEKSGGQSGGSNGGSSTGRRKGRKGAKQNDSGTPANEPPAQDKTDSNGRTPAQIAAAAHAAAVSAEDKNHTAKEPGRQDVEAPEPQAVAPEAKTPEQTMVDVEPAPTPAAEAPVDDPAPARRARRRRGRVVAPAGPPPASLEKADDGG